MVKNNVNKLQQVQDSMPISTPQKAIEYLAARNELPLLRKRYVRDLPMIRKVQADFFTYAFNGPNMLQRRLERAKNPVLTRLHNLTTPWMMRRRVFEDMWMLYTLLSGKHGNDFLV